MRCVTRLVALLWLGCVPFGVIASAGNSVAGEFVGSTPGDALAREFLGGLATNAPCHYIRWQITLLTNQNTYRVVARYGIPARNNPNQSEDGPSVSSQGTWEIVKSAKPDAVVYRLTAEKSQRSLSFVKVGDNLLQVLNPDGSLMIGNGGWSYTLNRADHAEKPTDRSLAMNAPDMSYKISPLAAGPTVFGVFEGRSPCQGIARMLRLSVDAACMKVKWRVTLYQNPETRAPSTYKIEGSLHRQAAREGNWTILPGPDRTGSLTTCHMARCRSSMNRSSTAEASSCSSGSKKRRVLTNTTGPK